MKVLKADQCLSIHRIASGIHRYSENQNKTGVIVLWLCIELMCSIDAKIFMSGINIETEVLLLWYTGCL